MNNLKLAKQNYPKNSYFLSATNKINTPLKVTSLRVSEITGDIVNEEGGVVWDKELNIWATKLNY